MESLRVLQNQSLRQLLSTRPTLTRQTFRQLSQTTKQQFRTRPVSTVASLARRPRTTQTLVAQHTSRSLRRPQTHRFQSTAPESAPSDQNLSLSQRLKKLSREYGWSALGVYLLLSALDFPFCFLAVKWLGTDRIGRWEHIIVSWVKGVIQWPVYGAETEPALEIAGVGAVGEAGSGEGKRVLEEEHETYILEDHGYVEAEKANRGENASLWTQLALAYAIHKSFIFIRVPLTAAVTPKVVKTLRGWGWNIGKMPTRKGAKGAVTSGSGSTGSGTGINTKGTGVKPD